MWKMFWLLGYRCCYCWLWGSHPIPFACAKISNTQGDSTDTDTHAINIYSRQRKPFAKFTSYSLTMMPILMLVEMMAR